MGRDIDSLRILTELLRDVWGLGTLGQVLSVWFSQSNLQSAFGGLASAYLVLCATLCASKLSAGCCLASACRCA